MKIKKALKRTFQFICLFILFVLVINTSLFDQELSSEAKEILQKAEYPKIEGNAYFALMGVKAASDKNISQTGHLLVQRYIENLNNQKDRLSDEDYTELLGVESDEKFPYSHVNKSCYHRDSRFECLSLKEEELKNNYFNGYTDHPEFQSMLNRHHEILNLKSFLSFTEGGLALPLPSYGTLFKLGEWHLINLYKNHSSEEFLSALHKDLQFWKMVLNQDVYLIGKMVAFNRIQKHMLFLSEFIRSNEIKEGQRALLNEILTPLTAEEMDLSESFKSEAKMMNRIHYLKTGQISFWDELFYQPNASINYYIETSLKDQIEWSVSTTSEIVKKRKEKPEHNDWSIKPHFIYNFVGKVLTEYGRFAWDDYIVRGHDVNNMIRLVQLQLKIKDSREQQIFETLNKPENRNPFNNKPYNYNEESRVLGFKCLDKIQKCEIKI